MSGKILQVNISLGGLPKRPISLGKVTKAGLLGDFFAHPKLHGGPSQAVLIIANEAISSLLALGFPVFPGALGENLTTTGLHPSSWRSGQQFHVGSARIELTKPREPCRALDIYSSSTPIRPALYSPGIKLGDTAALHWGKSGFYARVIQEGDIAPGDIIVLESQLA